MVNVTTPEIEDTEIVMIHNHKAVFSRYSDGSYGVVMDNDRGTLTRNVPANKTNGTSFQNYVDCMTRELMQYIGMRRIA